MQRGGEPIDAGADHDRIVSHSLAPALRRPGRLAAKPVACQRRYFISKMFRLDFRLTATTRFFVEIL
jgi:hypothetical protein